MPGSSASRKPADVADSDWLERCKSANCCQCVLGQAQCSWSDRWWTVPVPIGLSTLTKEVSMKRARKTPGSAPVDQNAHQAPLEPVAPDTPTAKPGNDDAAARLTQEIKVLRETLSRK